VRQALSLAVRILAVAIVLLVGLSVAAVVSGVAQPPPETSGTASASSPPDDAGMAFVAIPLFCVLVATVFSWMVLRSRLAGWPLVGAVFLAYFGLGTFLPQIESVVFLPKQLPPGFVTRLFVMGALSGLVFAPAAALLLGRRKWAQTPELAPPRGARMGWRPIAFLAAAYVAVYFLAGYFIAYRNPELIAYYDDTDAGSFLAQLAKIWATAPWLFALQALRGVLWVACVMPFLLTFQGRRFELSLLIGCAYSVWTVMLLAPNAYMPESIRMSHLFETAVSDFLFGCLVGVTLASGPSDGRARGSRQRNDAGLSQADVPRKDLIEGREKS
jgi:hypothetical protein